MIFRGRNLSLVNLFCRHKWYLARVCYFNEPSTVFEIQKRGFSPESEKKKKRWIYGSILKISRYCFSETRGNLAFYVTALSRHCLKRKLRIVFYPRLILFPIILYFYFDGWRQLKHWAYKVSYDKTKNLSLTSVILKGRNLSLVNLFCRQQWYLARVCYYNGPNRKFAEVFCYKKKEQLRWRIASFKTTSILTLSSYLHGRVILSKIFRCCFADGNSRICMEEKLATLSQLKRSHFYRRTMLAFEQTTLSGIKTLFIKKG